MIRLLMLLALAVATTAPARALEWAVGVQAIGSSHSLSGDLPNEGDWKGQFSGGAGLSFDLSVGPDVTLSAQPAWVPRRCTQQFVDRGVVISESQFEFDYLVVPLLVRVDSTPRRFQGFVTAGLSLGYLMNAELDRGSGGVEVTDQFDAFTTGALFGAGMLVGVGNQRLSLEIRYEQGLDDIVDRDAPTPFGAQSSPSIKYREFKFVVGILFGFGGRR
jgi:hypothetical protein